MTHRARSLSALLIAVAAPFAAACSSDDDAASTTEVVVAGAPLSINGPLVAAGPEGDVIVGTVQNITDRAIQITSATSSAGDVEFRSGDGLLLTSLEVEPGAELEFTTDGIHLALVEVTDADSVDVVLGLDIQDDFTFTADRAPDE